MVKTDFYHGSLQQIPGQNLTGFRCLMIFCLSLSGLYSEAMIELYGGRSKNGLKENNTSLKSFQSELFVLLEQGQT